jgi:hypothetical protein
VLGLGVLGHVVQRLLGDPVQDRLDLGRQAGFQPEADVDGDPGLLLEPHGVLAEGLAEAAVVEHGRPQGAHQVAQHPHLLADALLDRLKDLVGPLELADQAVAGRPADQVG